MAKRMARGGGPDIHGPESYGSDYLSDEQFDPASGMEQEQAQMDRVTFATSMSMLTGGELHDMGRGVGPVVGTPYDDSPLGEERSFVTYKEGSSRMGSRGDGANNDHAPMGHTGKEKDMISGTIGRTMNRRGR